MLGVAFALAAFLTDGGRAALDHGFWETTLPYITDTGDRLPLPKSPQRELLRGAHGGHLAETTFRNAALDPPVG